jgi:hypothetical protein
MCVRKSAVLKKLNNCIMSLGSSSLCASVDFQLPAQIAPFLLDIDSPSTTHSLFWGSSIDSSIDEYGTQMAEAEMPAIEKNEK